jgi:hypothetical protein
MNQPRGVPRLHRAGRRVLPLTATVVLAGCSDPDWTRVVGTLNLGTERTIIATAPTQVAAGEEFVLTVATVGSSSCTRADGNDLTVSGSVARFVPYDEVPTDDRGCIRNEAPFPHTDVLSFPQPGTSTVWVVGKFGPMDGAVLDSVELEIQVTAPD